MSEIDGFGGPEIPKIEVWDVPKVGFRGFWPKCAIPGGYPQNRDFDLPGVDF